MRLVTRTVLASALVALAAVIGVGALAHSRAIAYTPQVVMIDSDAPAQPPGSPGRGYWGFGPGHISVAQGDQIEFDNPAGNKVAHTVTSITWAGTAPNRTLESGAKFNSSPTTEAYIRPGSNWMLDTSPLEAGQYLYYCQIHPWMVGTFTVTAGS